MSYPSPPDDEYPGPPAVNEGMWKPFKARKKSIPHKAGCHGDHHVGGCRKARPKCKAMRARSEKHRVCRCDAYWFPHRNGSGACRVGVPALILASPAWKRMNKEEPEPSDS